MGFDYSALRDDAINFRIGLSEGSLMLDALDIAGILDHESMSPEIPARVLARLKNLEEGDPWPLEGDLDDESLAFYSFSSARTDLVPLRKLVDNEEWIISPRECEVMANVLLDIGERQRMLVFGESGGRIIRERGFGTRDWHDSFVTLLGEFGGFCKASANAGGFWSY